MRVTRRVSQVSIIPVALRYFGSVDTDKSATAPIITSASCSNNRIRFERFPQRHRIITTRRASVRCEPRQTTLGKLSLVEPGRQRRLRDTEILRDLPLRHTTLSGQSDHIALEIICILLRHNAPSSRTTKRCGSRINQSFSSLKSWWTRQAAWVMLSAITIPARQRK